MSLYFRIPWRNIFRERKRSFTLGANYAVVTIILVALFSFSEGARQNISSNLVQASAGHITISGSYERDGELYSGVKGYERVADVVRTSLDEETTVLPRYVVNSTLYHEGSSRLLQFTGIQPENDTGLRDQITIVEGNWDRFMESSNAAIIPQSAADYFGLSVGAEVVLSARTRFGAFNTGILEVAGIYTTNNFFIEQIVINHFSFLQELDLARDDVASLLYVYTGNRDTIARNRATLLEALREAGYETSQPEAGEEALQAVTSATPATGSEQADPGTRRLTLSTLQEVLGLAGQVLNAVNVTGSIIAAVMLFIVAVSVFINLRVTIHERLQEIGTMRAFGFESRTVTALFVIENAMLALLFVAIGIGLALGIIAIVRVAIELPATQTLSLFLEDNHLVLRPLPIHLILITLAVAGFGALFAIFPARYGGKVEPVEAIRQTF